MKNMPLTADEIGALEAASLLAGVHVSDDLLDDDIMCCMEQGMALLPCVASAGRYYASIVGTTDNAGAAVWEALSAAPWLK